MRKISLLYFLLISLFGTIDVQAQISFSKEYGGAYNEDGRWMEQMPDSGFILTGGTSTYSNGQTDIWLVRTDAYGNTLWTKSIGGIAFDFANMVKPVPGGFVICGVTNRTGSDDAILVKTDINGNTLWTTVLGDANIQWFEGVVLNSDGGYTAVGVNTGAGTHGGYDIYLVKFTSAGAVVWEKSIGGGSYEIGNSIQQTSDGGYILSGQTYSYGNFDGDFYLVKTDSTGGVVWQKTYGEPHLQEAHYAQITPDGGYIIVGDADTLPNGLGDTDVWMIKTDSNGNVLWDKVYGGTKKDGGKTVENTSDGGFIVAGITRSFGLNNPNYYLFKTDSLGTIEWEKSNYGTQLYHDHAYRAIETSDYGFAEFGFFRNSLGFQNFALVKLGPNAGITKDLAVDGLIAPKLNLCRSNNVPLSVQLTNFGATNEINISVDLVIDNGTTTTNYTDTFVGSLTPGNSTILTFSQTYDFNVDGAYSVKAYIHHRNSDISYTNDTSDVVVNVIPPTADPVTTSAVLCGTGSLTLNSTPAAAADSMFWYDAAVNGNLIATGSSYTTPSLNNTASYYVQSVKGKGSMVGMTDNLIGTGGVTNNGYLKFDARINFKLISVWVYPLSAGSRTIELRNSGGTVLQSKTINLPIAAGGMRVYLNFDIPQQNDLILGLSNGSVGLFRNSTGAVLPYSVSQTVEINGTSGNQGTYYYFYDWYVFVPSQSCASNRVMTQAIIGSSSTTSFNGSRCGNGPVTLSANSTASLAWFANSTGGSSLATGTTYTTPSLSSTTTYYLEVGSCPNRIAVDAIVNAQSTSPSALDVTRCGPGTVSLTATATDPIYWYNSAANGTVLHSGSPFVTPYLNSTTTYYVVAGSVCPSAPLAVDAIINSAVAPTVTGATACGPASVTISASSPDPVSWYTVPTGGSPISTLNAYTTPVLGTPTTYYVEAGTICPSPRVPVVANVVVTDPPVGTGASRCGQGSLVISAQSLNSVTWWTSASGGSQVGSGLIFTTPTLNATTVYYAQASGSGCNSSRTPVSATITVTTPPQVTQGAHCGPGPVILGATASDSIFWYTAPTGGTLLGTGTSYTTPSISTTTTYYAQAGGVCPSTRTSVNAVITSQAADPVTTDSSRCNTGVVTLIATSPDPITWFDAPGGTILGTGNTFVTPSISATTTYYAVAGITGCISNAVAAVATINPMPADPSVTGNHNCGPAQLTLSASSTYPLTWYNQATGGTILTTGSTYSSNFNSTTTVYVEAFDGKCSSNRIAVTASIYNLPQVNLGPAVITINSGQTITLDAGAGYANYLWSTTATTRTINVNSTGVYYVTVTDIHSCTGSDTITVNVVNGINDVSLNDVLEIFPNPTTGIVNVVVNKPALHFNLQILDVTGRILFMREHNDSGIFDENYNFSGFAKGVYYLRIVSTEGNTTRTLILE